MDIFFFQAEDGIRDGHVTGVQTCALPIWAAMERLIQASWELVAQFRNVLIAAQDALSPARIRELHATPGARAGDLIERGREAGVFRSDLPVTWLVGVLHNGIHGAADEINAGRLTVSEAPRTISA